MLINIIHKTFNVSDVAKVCRQAVPNGSKSIIPPVLPKTKMPVQSAPLQETPCSLYRTLISHNYSIQSGIARTVQVRFSHTDVPPPNFSAYKKKRKSDDKFDDDADRKFSPYAVTLVASVAATWMTKVATVGLLDTFNPTADVLALANTEINLNKVPEGKNVTFKWRGKPLFVRHRTQEEIEKERQTSLSDLKDPEPDENRVVRPEWLVVLGICTHLGCVPIANAGDWGAYFCPCHGSHYDFSGRIRKGPAPLNLEVPPYKFIDDNTLFVGEK